MNEGISKMSRIRRAAVPGIILIASTLLFSCSDPEQQEKLGEAIRGIQKTLSDATEKLTEAAPAPGEVKSIASEELAKLSAIEYRIVDFDEDVPAAEMQNMLARLGNERWDCFSTATIGRKIRVFCRRRPESYLRHVQRILPLPLP